MIDNSELIRKQFYFNEANDMFEECRELKWFTEPQKKHLKDAAKALCKVIDKH